MQGHAGARARLGLAALAVLLAVAGPARASRTPPPITVASAPTTASAWARWTAPPKPRLTRAQAVGIVLATARAQLGKPYKWGTAGPKSFDCSGLTRYAWAAAGVKIPRVSRWQYRQLPHVAVKDLRPGDLVFFGRRRIHHVGIYIGGGKMINAPYSGARVRIEPLLSDVAGAARPTV